MDDQKLFSAMLAFCYTTNGEKYKNIFPFIKYTSAGNFITLNNIKNSYTQSVPCIPFIKIEECCYSTLFHIELLKLKFRKIDSLLSTGVFSIHIVFLTNNTVLINLKHLFFTKKSKFFIIRLFSINADLRWLDKVFYPFLPKRIKLETKRKMLNYKVEQIESEILIQNKQDTSIKFEYKRLKNLIKAIKQEYKKSKKDKGIIP